uniref:CWF21 domain-containing protein n=1 Tax=Leptocylindrus danicus TaxID=163516 RepID=A0A7S2LU52_9STRA|mmetsp:Transcript_9247/g.13893  ORF Transcript_9247/g.13893 Transcript_9247/m.13893 type:complete len:295 (+) Transcript_9247:52-936(+)
MYNGIGLTTVRGTATSGHVQSNRSYVRPSQERWTTRQRQNHQTSTSNTTTTSLSATRRPNAKLLEHQRRRELENKVLEYRLSLENRRGELTLKQKEVEERVKDRRAFLEKEYRDYMYQVSVSVSVRRREEEERRQRRTALLQQKESNVAQNALKSLENGTVDDDGDGAACAPAEETKKSEAAEFKNDKDHHRAIIPAPAPAPAPRGGPTNNYRDRRIPGRRNDYYHSSRNRSQQRAERRQARNTTDTHAKAAIKDTENARLRGAFGIDDRTFVSGQAFDRDLAKLVVLFCTHIR